MAKTISELKAQSAEVKNASAIGENTATRVGQLFGDIVEHVEQYETNKDGKDASQDAQMQSLVSAEESRAKGEERGLQNQIHAEKIDRQTADTYLGNLIQQESSARETADENIRTALANETARAQAAEQELAAAQIYTAKIKDGAVTTPKIADGAVTYEKTDIIAQELGTNITKVPSQKVVTDAIQKEETERKADINGLATALASETISREQGDENLNAAIEAEAANRKADVDGLTAALASETISREQGDENLNAAIEAEAEARDNAINNEAQARSQNDALLNRSIIAEKDRAEAREQELTVAIQQETERAKAAEEANAAAVDDVTFTIGYSTKKQLLDNVAFNPSEGSYYIGSNGNVLTGPGQYDRCTDFIEVNGNTSYVYTGRLEARRYIAEYDSEKTFIRSFTASDDVQNLTSLSFTTAENTKYVRLSVYYVKTYTLHKVVNERVIDKINTLDNSIQDSIATAIQEETARAQAAEQANATAIIGTDRKLTGLEQKINEIDVQINGGEINKYEDIVFTTLESIPGMPILNSDTPQWLVSSRSSSYEIEISDFNRIKIESSRNTTIAFFKKKMDITSSVDTNTLVLREYINSIDDFVAIETDSVVEFNIPQGTKYVYIWHINWNNTIDYTPKSVTLILHNQNNGLVNKVEDIEAKTASIDQRITKLENPTSILAEILFTKVGKGSYVGDIDNTVQEASNSYRCKYKISVVGGKKYFVSDIVDNLFVADDNNVILQKYQLVTDNKKCICISTPKTAAVIYVTGYNEKTPMLYELEENNNKFVQSKGYAEPIITELEDSVMSVFGKSAKVINASGESKQVLEIGNAKRYVGLWIRIPYTDSLKFRDENVSMIVSFIGEDGSELKNVDFSIPRYESCYYYAVKNWLYINYTNTASSNIGCKRVEISWNTNVDFKIYIAPFFVVNCLMSPAFVYNLEHWSDGRTKIDAFLSRGIKLSITGNIPNTEDDIEYVTNACNNQMIDYGIYGNELNNGADSLLDQADVDAANKYAQKRIVEHLKITDSVVSFGQGAHANSAKTAFECKSNGLKAIRVAMNNYFIPMTNDKSCLVIPMIASSINFDIANINMFVSIFTHTYDYVVNESALDKIKNIVDSGFLITTTMRELYEHIEEFYIDRY